MPEIGTFGLMSGDGKRSVGHRPQATAPILDSTIASLVECRLSASCGRWPDRLRRCGTPAEARGRTRAEGSGALRMQRARLSRTELAEKTSNGLQPTHRISKGPIVILFEQGPDLCHHRGEACALGLH